VPLRTHYYTHCVWDCQTKRAPVLPGETQGSKSGRRLFAVHPVKRTMKNRTNWIAACHYGGQQFSMQP